MNETQFRKIVRNLLSEDKEDPETSKKAGKKQKASKSDTNPGEIGVAVGRGAWSKKVKEAGALAESDPKSLMDRLGIDKSGKDLDGIVTILKQALTHDIMSQAYVGLGSINKGSKRAVTTTPSGLDQRNGIKYIQHTLTGAKNAGNLSLSVPIQVGPQDDGSIVIYVSSKKNSW
tara:strand:+ start:13251 stop:13772 length:522 start_codon:yes stop_codon:yes gene_type:complete